jgi:hypothetical protein
MKRFLRFQILGIIGLLPFICKGDALSNDTPAMGFKSPGIPVLDGLIR